MFGVKVILPLQDKKFLSHPFVPASFCSIKYPDRICFIAGYGKCYYKVSDFRWRPF